jgi:esterase/lipase superfamily enzyme
MPAPSLFGPDGVDPFEAVPAPLRRARAHVLYATNRLPDPLSEGLAYTGERSFDVQLGVASVAFGEEGEDPSWPDVSQGRRPPDAPTMPLRVTSYHRFADRRYFVQVANEGLALSPTREVVLYVHGYNTTMDSAVFHLAGLWHFMGRDTVPILFSWPAGLSGVTGYVADKDSAEFSVLYLKRLLRELGRDVRYEKLHIICHSAGTELVATALRELLLEHSSDPLAARRDMRLGHVVVAAPDIDADVVRTRIIEERVHLVPERLTLYFTPRDLALNFSMVLRAGLPRWGAVGLPRLEDLGLPTLEAERGAAMGVDSVRKLGDIPSIDAVDASDVVGGFFLAHDYFLDSPEVSADIVAAVKYGWNPVDHPKLRPLEPVVNERGKRTFRIPSGYLAKPSPEWIQAAQERRPGVRPRVAAAVTTPQPTPVLTSEGSASPGAP